MLIEMREPCRFCRNATGTMEMKNGQDTVRCAWCNKHCYNAPKSETGREQRSLRTRPNIKVSQRSRILLRDNATCILCHRTDIAIDIGHIISVQDGRAEGMTDTELFHDENLATMCDSCNSGLSSETLPLRILISVLKARIRNEDSPGAGGEHINGATQRESERT
jgi:5-methylcytosine-specific restriction endonuclease McrA